MISTEMRFICTLTVLGLSACGSSKNSPVSNNHDSSDASAANAAVESDKSAGPLPGVSASSDTASNAPVISSKATDRNVMAITVDGSLCGGPQTQYINEPCVAVTICAPGTNNCQTIKNILLDTGSAGLRLFKSVLTVPTSPVLAADGGTLTECVSYTGAASDWGPVARVDLKLAGEPTVQVPLQIIDSTFATPSPLCTAAQSTPDISPDQAGFNGILGVNMLVQDCGDFCSTNADNNYYYSCDTKGKCTGTTTKVQVQNPITLLPQDNNGVLISLPAVPAAGAASVGGTMILGIGTLPNNTPPATVKTFTTDEVGEFLSAYPVGSKAIPAFIDSGSNSLILPQGNLAACAENSLGSGYFCQTSPANLTATTLNATSTVMASVNFSIGDGLALLGSGNMAFANLSLVLRNAQSGSGGAFDWGLPFFFGRTVYFGFDKQASQLGAGPYYAY